MKREDKVISLELARQIDAEHKRLGIGVESEWWWECEWACFPKIIFKFTKMNHEYDFKKGIKLGLCGKDHFSWYPAYDTAELGATLEKYVDTERDYEEEMFMSYFYTATGWEVGLNWQTVDPEGESGYNDYKEYGETETEARGKMYLWLLQNDYIKGV